MFMTGNKQATKQTNNYLGTELPEKGIDII